MKNENFEKFEYLKLKYQKELNLLKKHDWILDSKEGLYNQKTGCCFSIADYLEEFIADKYEELNQEVFVLNESDFQSFIEKYGYEIVCESPLEIIKNNKDKATGECALFLKQSLIEVYKRQMRLYI